MKTDMLMWHVIKLFLKHKKQLLERLGLTNSQFEILAAIHYLQGAKSGREVKSGIIQAELSGKTAIDPMTTSTISRNLQQRGLITRCRNPVNTRTVEVKLTAGGLDLLERAYQQIRLSNELIYEDINKKNFTIQLEKISDKLNKLNQLNY